MIDLTALRLPDGTQGLLWDMDGVLIDSIQLDFAVCAPLMSKYAGREVALSRDVIRRGFHLAIEDFFPYLAREAGIEIGADDMAKLITEYDQKRLRTDYPLTPRISQVLASARNAGLKQAVVSNNATAHIEATLMSAGLRDQFDAVIGNDIDGLRKKPAPDPYLAGAKALGLDPADCVVIEDSLPGTKAGRDAGCFVIGVATGGASVNELEAADSTDVVYAAFGPYHVTLKPGAVRDKTILTPNDFVSHMIEHIAWRLGTGIDLTWPDTRWHELGAAVGSAIARFEPTARQAAALGMIDDGSAEVMVDLDGETGAHLSAIDTVDSTLFLESRCEQIDSGAPLIALLDGLAEGLQARIDMRICAFEDPHHTWEGAYRALGIALSRLYPLPADHTPSAVTERATEKPAFEQGDGVIRTVSASRDHAELVRLTAESETRLKVRFGNERTSRVALDVNPSIDVADLPRILDLICARAGFSIDLTFKATKLSSSHVVLEDTGIILGKALLAVLMERMEWEGVNGAGSSIQDGADFTNAAPQVGISVEGRKFLKITPFTDDYMAVRRDLLFGHTVFGALRSEDLDDFLDGLCVGMTCSLMVHLRELKTPEADWTAVLEQLGAALNECFAPNPARKGLPPGVKATLA